MSDSYLIKAIPVEQLSKFWSFAIPYVKRSLDKMNGELVLKDILENLENKSAQLWLLLNKSDKRVCGSVITTMVSYPQRMNCRFLCFSGPKFDEWQDLATEVIGEWALSQGCKGLEAFVRKGYVYTLSNTGWMHKYNVVTKDLIPAKDISLYDLSTADAQVYSEPLCKI